MAGGSSRPGRSVTSNAPVSPSAVDTTRRTLNLAEISTSADLPLSTIDRQVR
ncbi:hypothetical protein OK351_14805 [Glutamicibacter sp. MNS18]|uniref:hypothetical protein n=1 Tax=Glutamicibacter sp. MNS18 TaxID=2989817 RepID=UPI0022361AC3|nr:hypothetical protein [Glutamicibacter sp. MNS18]MCW4466761.1 hypothetical protein [Glutamicibacter sp. MNS18]